MTLSRDIYTPEELAQELRVGKRTVLKAIKLEKLVAARLGGNVIRIWRDDVLTWLTEHCGPDDGKPELGPDFASESGW